jgi:cytoskeletal protein CcmA (bactofilin family)
VEIGNLLNAEVVEIKLYGPSRAIEIGGGKITINKAMSIPLIGKYSPGAYGAMQAESIEGDEIHLENTKASVVRGRNVYIGTGCEIGLVEYRNEYKQDNGAEVAQYNRI